MTQTVIGVFDSYVDASRAQQALTDANFAPDDISVYSAAIEGHVKSGPRVYARSAGSMQRGAIAGPLEQREALEQLERLFARTFRQGEFPSETESYREVIRRGGAVVSVDTSDADAGAAQEAMTRMGAVDIDELAAVWRRDDSLSRVVEDKAGCHSSSGMAADTTTPSRSQSGANLAQEVPRSTSCNMNAGPPAGQPAREPAAPSPSPAAGAGVSPSDRSGGSSSPVSNTRQVRETSADSLRDSPTSTRAEDEYGSDDEAFRRDYDRRYANIGESYEDYQQAYRHGATVGRDARYREYDWPDVEADIRRDWESSYPDSGWDRFKLAVRHGWSRVTGRD
jgi:hypothetical protein